jgi:hypothetical protein
MIKPDEIAFSASTVSRQKRVDLDRVPTNRTVHELLQGVLVPRLNLPRVDSAGHSVDFTLRRDRDGAEVRVSQTIGESLETGDHVVVQPKIFAGGDSR